ncbi:T9SS type B sorting domain-containing protein [Vicingus serpentipes]|uniref:T9SS type B sorting domain-containing protein n=1 Tax=Vicingus serpentipes TaxID=1926625 RepID=A0A5C6RYI3_9FLAO|nr:gliding motility-associated C-terminal domain-containing protein [Vicingus serpentipes]TXB67144.1 T9SS type B sorting domain-containing protein [Vicingus serpentipes]
MFKNIYIKSFILAFSFLTFSQTAKAQLDSCDASVPYHYVDLTGQPEGSWLSPPHKRDGSCCGAAPNCTSFEVLLDSNAAALSFQFYSGAVPTGSLSYQIDCGPSVAVGEPICIAGVGPHRITFCKPGSNTNEYLITSIAKPTFPQDDSIRSGCSKKIEVLGFEEPTITWQSVAPGAPGDYDNLLSCTSNCSETVFTPTPTTPAFIDYVVCGFPQADECGYTLTLCDTFRIYTVDSLKGSVSPNPATFCQVGPGSGVNINASGIGGDGTYNYTWYNNLGDSVGFGPSFYATSQQTYSIEINDGLSGPSCAANFMSVSVVETSEPIVEAGDNQLLCADVTEVSLTGSVSFATGAYWSGGNGAYSPDSTTLITNYFPTPSEINSGLLELYLTSTGAGGSCSNKTDTVLITFPAQLTVELSDTLLKCNDDQVLLNPTVTGGVTPYTYFWSNGTSSSTTTVGEGNYCLSISDDLGCFTDTCINVSVPSELTIAVSSTAATTNGGNDGTATALLSGGTSPYQYNWTPSGSTSTITNLSYGIYTVTATDTNGCSVDGSVVVSEPRCLGFSISTSSDTLQCYGDASSTAYVTPIGGTTPYTYQWDDPLSQTDSLITGLSSGLYTIVVTDASSCLAVTTANIIQPNQLVNTITSSNATTVGGANGSASAHPFGGTPPYSFAWSNLETTQTISNLLAGTYYLTITDDNGCSIIDSVKINEPPCNNYLLYVSGTELSCNGVLDGQAQVTVVGGTEPYNILWSTGESTNTISGLSATTYSVEVTDSNNCYSFKNITITQPNILQATANLVNDISCFGIVDGTVDLIVAGGTYPYTYSWSNGQSSEDITNLAQGSYNVAVTDLNGCTATDSISISEPTKINTSFTKIDVNCNSDSTGSINLSVNGGVIPYSYLWSNGDTIQDITNLTAGLYNFTVFDANNCQSPLGSSILISEPDSVTLDSFFVNCPIPGGTTTMVDFFPNGGTSAYQISTDSGTTYLPFLNYSAPLSIDNIHQIMVKDTNGCLSSGLNPITINPLVTIDSVAFEKCYTDAQTLSAVEAFISGGDAGVYQVSFDNGLNFETPGNYTGNLPINNSYSFVAQDQLGCLSVPFNISIPDRILANAIITSDYNGNDVACNGDTNGIALAQANGGQSPYSYLWSNGQTDSIAINLGATNYQVYITDINNCVDTADITLSQPTIVILDSFFVNCPIPGGTTTMVDFYPNGGTSAYQISTDSGTTYLPFLNYSASLSIDNIHQIMVKDTNGCLSSGLNPITINPLVTIDSVAFEKCYTDAQTLSAVEAFVSGGDAGVYQVSFDNGLNFETPGNYTGNLPINNSYSFVAQDQLGCLSVPFNISIPDRILANAIITSDYNGNDVACNGDTNGIALAQANGGQSPYSYLWSNGQTDSIAINLGATNYQVYITDINNCVDTADITLSQPTIVILDSFFVNCPIPGGTTTMVDFYPNGGTSAYQISTDSGTTYLPFLNYSASLSIDNIHQIMVKDTNGCLSSGLNPITINPLVTIDSVAFEKCYTDAQTLSAVEAFVSGGDAGVYQVSFDNGLNFETPGNYTGNLPINNSYSFVAQDQLGCLSVPFNISIPDRILANANITSDYNGNDVACNGDTNGIALAQANGGQSPYSYLWSNGQSDSIAINLGATNYQVYITDINNCVDTADITLSQPDSISETISVSSNYNGYDISCFGASDGSIDLNVLGGTSPYAFLWNNLAVTEDPSNLSSGYYKVIITDINGCSDSTEITLNQPDSIILTSIIDHVKCNAYTDGSIDLTVTGGVSPYQYNWSNSEITEDITNIGQGNYNITVTDLNDCIASTSYSVDEESPLILSHTQENITCYNFANGSIDLSVNGGVLPYIYTWNNLSQDEDLQDLTPGTYSVLVTDSNNCFKNDTIYITQPDSLWADISSDLYPNGHNISLYQMADGSINLDVYGGTLPYQFEWSNGSSNEDLNNLIAGMYSVILTDNNGCKYNTEIVLTQPFELEMPTVITPNGDGNNDYFVVHGIESFPSNSIIIFNRWGDEVYNMTNYDNKWQGQSNKGNDLPAGNYFIILKIDNQDITLTGYVEILR